MSQNMKHLKLNSVTDNDIIQRCYEMIYIPSVA